MLGLRVQAKRPFGEGVVIFKIGRRSFLVRLGGAAAAWPLAASAQQPGSMRRIGVLMSTADDSLGQAWSGALTGELQRLGWQAGRNLQIDMRWGAGDAELFRRYAAELEMCIRDRPRCAAMRLLPKRNDDGCRGASEGEAETD